MSRRTFALCSLLLISICILSYSVVIAQSSAATPTVQTSASAPVASGYPNEPDPALTPGAVLNVTCPDICTPGYSKKVRNVPQSLKFQVFQRYHIVPKPGDKFEIDHLISLELGGSNAITNLWPESYQGKWNAHQKDALENRMHSLVCGHTLSLDTAQQEISHDWKSAFVKYFGHIPADTLQKGGNPSVQAP